MWPRPKSAVFNLIGMASNLLAMASKVLFESSLLRVLSSHGSEIWRLMLGFVVPEVSGPRVFLRKLRASSGEMNMGITYAHANASRQ